jgi:hypothetical protein
MSNLITIRQWLSSRGLAFISDVKLYEHSQKLVLEIPRAKLAAKSGAGFTSMRQLALLAREIKRRFGLEVLIALRENEQSADIEAGLRAVLARTFPGVLQDAFISYPEADRAFVWIVPAQAIDEGKSAEVHASAVSFLQSVGINCEGVEFLAPLAPEPSTAAVLRSIKLLAPADIAALAVDLKRRGFSYPSEKWLAARLDAARKRGLLIRRKDGAFVLTADGLLVVPHTRSRRSSDVERMLLLARRRKW